jgi:hypothetical protein
VSYAPYNAIRSTAFKGVDNLETEDYGRKHFALRILKSIQEYLKSGNHGNSAVYPINVPNDLLVLVLKHHGTEFADELINEIFRIGVKAWAEEFYLEVFEGPENLESFVEEVTRGR